MRGQKEEKKEKKKEEKEEKKEEKKEKKKGEKEEKKNENCCGWTGRTTSKALYEVLADPIRCHLVIFCSGSQCRSSEKSNNKSSKKLSSTFFSTDMKYSLNSINPKKLSLELSTSSIPRCSERPRFECETNLVHCSALNCCCNVAFATPRPSPGPGG